MFRTALTDFLSGRGKSLAYVGTALALTGAGTATAVAASSPAPAGIASAVRHINVGDDAGAPLGPAVVSAEHPAAHTTGAQTAAAARKNAPDLNAPAKNAAPKKAPAKKAPGKSAPPHAARKAQVTVVRHTDSPASWKQVRDTLASQTFPRPAPGKLPLQDRLMPGSASGPQATMPITASRMANATTIVRQTLNKHMGLRSAVVAVATAMQESTLENIDYGDRDSLGLFQQRPSCGWGSPAQITDPSYAADAFLSALHQHQQADPGWAGQPLWQTAQSVQDSGYPYAYAKWESQAAQLVSSIARHLV